jgi:hypothetical protein
MTGKDGRMARRGFVGRMVAGAAAAGAVGLAPGELAAAPAPDPDLLARARELEQDHPKQSWDLTWVDRCTGKFRQVFDAPEIAEGTVLHQARMFFQGFAEVYDAKDADCSAVLVIRHAAIPMVANDRLWDELELGRQFKLKDPVTGKPARRNPFLNANTPADAKYGLLWPDGGLDTLLRRGAIALGCNLALFRLVSLVAGRDRIETKPAREKVLANLVPGVVVQPSGIFAVIRAEQAGCHYLRAT